MAQTFESFEAFFPFYLAEHAHPVSRTLHYFGTTVGTAVLLYALATQRWGFILLYPVIGYGCAWLGHFVFEKNRPATFTYPLWSLMGDYRMLFLAATGQLAEPLAEGVARYGHTRDP